MDEPEGKTKRIIEGELKCGLIIARMVIDMNMNETRLCTIERIEQFLSAKVG